METKANYVVVGIFTVLAVIAAFAFVYWTAAIGDRGETAELRIRINGSAAGLGRGSAVLFNGIKVGDIRRVYIDVTNPSVAIAEAEVDRLTPLTKSTKIDVGIAGLTGQANIQMEGANPQEPNLLAEAERAGTVAEVTANPSAVTNLLQTAQDIFGRADNVLSELEGFVREVRGPLSETVGNIEKFSSALADNADGVDKFLASVSALSEELAGVSGKLDGTLKAAEELLNSVDRDQVKQIVANVETFTQQLTDAGSQIDGVFADVEGAVKSIKDFSDGANATLERLDRLVAEVDPETVKRAVGNIAEASDTAKRAVEDVAKVTSTFGERSGDIDKIISDASELADRLNQASVRVDGVLAKVDAFLGSGEAEGLAADASATLKSFRDVADSLNARIDTIASGLERFTGSGLRDVEALVEDGRRAINRIESAITDFERNPQKVISGGAGTVRQYDGRARR
ncbi:MAG: MCE family protein [Rhizobiaceae bacterium]|nr:MCE family protein [Rhizobiaceae bacterium]